MSSATVEPLRRRIIDDMEAALNERWPPLQWFQELLKRSHKQLVADFVGGAPARDLIRSRATLVDSLLAHTWHHFLGDHGRHLALVAVGGYGRGELHPGSDVDILVLIPDQPPADWQAPVEKLVAFLWDIGLDIGHSVRSVAECAREASADVSVVTNLTEARRLAGAEHLFEAMRAAISPRRMWADPDFFSAKWEEQLARHQKYHDTAYQLEPNVKESPGGLRDIHVVGWVAKRHFQAETLEELVEHGFLTEREYRSLSASQEFLWRVRMALHIIAKRRQDRLLFDHQLRVAEMLGYSDANNNLAVEQFMQQYYRTAKRVSRLNEMLLQLFQENILYPESDEPPKRLNKRFQSRRGFLEVTDDAVFKHYPFALLEIFLLMAQNPELKGVRASTIRSIRQYRNLIDADFRQDIRARTLFMEILRQPQGVTHELRRMNQYGVLGRYIPAFGQVVGRMQFDLFHAYTVDQHILFVIRNLRRLTIPAHYDEYPLCSQIMARIPKPELLYLAALFHDIAKGRGGDHSELGAGDAVMFCRQHGLSERDTELVEWLVQNHLLMSMTAQRRDLTDPQEIHDFAQRVRTLLRLDHLFLLTVADLRGTNPELLTTWKYALLVELYQATREALQRGLDNPVDSTEIIEGTQAQALALLSRAGVSEHDIKALWETFPGEYFLRHHAEEIAWQTQTVLEHTADSHPLVCLRSDPERGGTGIFIYTTDRDYLFGLVSAVLTQLGLTVQDARINSTNDGFALDTYMVLDESGSPIADVYRIEEIRRTLTAALASDTRPDTRINRRVSSKVRAFKTPTQVRFISEQGEEPYTVLELSAGDRPGLLAVVGRVFEQQAIRLHTAKIATIGERAEDTFYITDADHRPLSGAERQNALREALIEALDATTQ